MANPQREGGQAPGAGGSYGGADGGSGRRIEEARRRGGAQLVRGLLVAREGEVRLCAVLAESYPPQCGEPSLEVEGLDLDTVHGLASGDGVRWSERELAIHGMVDGDVLRVRG